MVTRSRGAGGCFLVAVFREAWRSNESEVGFLGKRAKDVLERGRSTEENEQSVEEYSRGLSQVAETVGLRLREMVS